MGATPTQTRIVNAAAARLGASGRVSSITEESSSLAIHSAACWDEMVRTLLAEHPWNFAIARTVLNEAADVPVFGAVRGFTLPADCLRWLPPHQGEDDWYAAEQEGDTLLTDAEGPLPVRYISSELGESISRWPPHFETAAVCALAERLAEPLTQSEGVKRDAADQADMALRKAKRADARASGTRTRARTNRGSSWLAARDRPYYNYGS